MNRYIQHTLLCLVVLGSMFTTSCRKENKSAPEITLVRVVDPTKADIAITQTNPGILVVIQGSNFAGLQKVLMNNFEVYVNPSFVTDNNIMVTIPDSLPLQGAHPTLPNTIRVVTNHGEATYNITFLSPKPAVRLFKFRVPAKPDSTLEIVGANFFVVKNIYMYRALFKDSIEVPDYTVNATYDRIKFAIPDGGDVDGHITVITESGSSSQQFLACRC